MHVQDNSGATYPCSELPKLGVIVRHREVCQRQSLPNTYSPHAMAKHPEPITSH